MADARTKTQQRRILGEGLALGAVMAGIRAIEGKRLTLELNFRKAWRRWSYAGHFPGISVGAQDDILVQVISNSASMMERIAYWEGHPYEPKLEHEWDFNEYAEVIDESIPADAWQDLSRMWLTPDAR